MRLIVADRALALHNLDHTAAVHGFLAVLAKQARERGWEVFQLDPPHRAARYCRHGSVMRSVRPDAFGVPRRDGEVRPFFLEWERRAVRPVTMAARPAPYLRDYASQCPTDDRGMRPAVLVVFDDELPRTNSGTSLARRCSSPGSTCRCRSRTSVSSRSRGRWAEFGSATCFARAERFHGFTGAQPAPNPAAPRCAPTARIPRRHRMGTMRPRPTAHRPAGRPRVRSDPRTGSPRMTSHSVPCVSTLR